MVHVDDVNGAGWPGLIRCFFVNMKGRQVHPRQQTLSGTVCILVRKYELAAPITLSKAISTVTSPRG